MNTIFPTHTHVKMSVSLLQSLLQRQTSIEYKLDGEWVESKTNGCSDEDNSSSCSDEEEDNTGHVVDETYEERLSVVRQLDMFTGNGVTVLNGKLTDDEFKQLMNDTHDQVYTWTQGMNTTTKAQRHAYVMEKFKQMIANSA